MDREKKLRNFLELINGNMTISQISSITGMSYNEINKLVYSLRQKGFVIDSKYYSNGEIGFMLDKNIYHDFKPTIITSKDEDEIEFLVYSDLHFGSFYETPKILDKLFNYGEKNNIHLHLNIGDLVEGTINDANRKTPWYNQVDHALKLYPHSDNVLVFLLLGNHDQSLIRDYGLNIATAISNKRLDIIPIGYGCKKIEIKNDSIILQHRLLKKSNINLDTPGYSLILRGHYHMYNLVIDTSNIIIYIPSLSLLNFRKCPFPGAVHLKIKMRYGLIEYVYVDELAYINGDFYITGSNELYAGKGKNFRKNTEVMNEEGFSKVLRRSNEKHM